MIFHNHNHIHYIYYSIIRCNHATISENDDPNTQLAASLVIAAVLAAAAYARVLMTTGASLFKKIKNSRCK